MPDIPLSALDTLFSTTTVGVLTGTDACASVIFPDLPHRITASARFLQSFDTVSI